MPYRTVQDELIPERVSAEISGYLKDPAGAALPGASLTTLVVTLYDRDTGAILNSRNAQDVLNVNGGAVDSAGRLTLQLTPSDTAIVEAAARSQRAAALFVFTWAGGTKTGSHELYFTVVNQEHRP